MTCYRRTARTAPSNPKQNQRSFNVYQFSGIVPCQFQVNTTTIIPVCILLVLVRVVRHFDSRVMSGTALLKNGDWTPEWWLRCTRGKKTWLLVVKKPFVSPSVVGVGWISHYTQPIPTISPVEWPITILWLHPHHRLHFYSILPWGINRTKLISSNHSWQAWF